MVALGLVEEVDRLLKAGHPPNLKPLRSHNYRHIIAYLLGQHGLEEAVRRTKQETRHYAKRQMTWFRSKNEITWFDVTDSDSARTTTLLIEHIQRRREQHGTSQD
jgi:tRNA dimethylallyltransferase